MIFVIIKDNYVVNRILAEEGFTYPHPHDLIVEDTDQNIHIGDWYEEAEGLFYRPVTGTPPDVPIELQPAGDGQA
jgi:hypothetical protein